MDDAKVDKKPFYKKAWFWIVAGLLVIAGIGAANPSQPAANESQEQQSSATYTITGGVLGQYGKEVVLNASTDMPTKKYLYKLPAGSYTVEISSGKSAQVGIVKDATVQTGSAPYTEELSYSSSVVVFSGEKKDITVSEDESVLVLDGDSIVVMKK